MQIKSVFFTLSLALYTNTASAQSVLTLKDAINTAINNYPSIKAKNAIVQASEENIEAARREKLPNINFSVQQDYGTINGTNGPLYGFGGLAAASAGPALASQNWNATFGGLYLTNINWEIFAFGKYKEQVKVAQQIRNRNLREYEQELFEHKIKVTAAYLNLIAAHQITSSYKKNLVRADSIRIFVVARVKGGLIAGVDSSLANAEYSNARILFTNALDKEQEQKNNLAKLLGQEDTAFEIDPTFIERLPGSYLDTQNDYKIHPILQYFKSRIAVSEEQTNYIKTLYYPSFSLVGVFQSRGSGFESNYSSNQHDFSKNYWDGIKPTRSNYLLGVGITWNLMQPIRLSKQANAQRLISKAMEEEYNEADLQIRTQLRTADSKMVNALSNFKEVPVQVKAATDAYNQKSVLYKNGLTNMVDVIQAAYSLIRAETNRDIAYNNVWQALLLKTAAMGDFNLFENEL